MRFQAYFTPVIKVLLYIMVAISVAGIIVAVLVFAGIQIELSKGQATLLISVCPVTAIVALLFATLHYKVEEHFLRLYCGFIDVLGGRIRIEKILNIVIDNDRMYISYLHTGVDPIIAAIVISPKRYNDMKNALLTKNPNIVFYNEDETDNSKQ